MACFENPQAETSSRKKALVHLPTGQVVSSYSFLEQVLTGLGWERYHGPDPDLIQFHKQSSIDLISLPRDFSTFNSLYMYDVVVKNPGVFQVRDVMDECVKTGVPPASDADNGTTLQISHLKILKFKCGWDALPAEVITINVQTKWVADAPGKQQRPAGGQRRRLIKVTVGNLCPK